MNHGNSKYTVKEKYTAVVLYKTVGNLQVVAKHTGVPYGTLRIWKETDWWQEFEEDIRQQGTSKLSTSLQKIVDKALFEVQDRLENGDYIWDQKQGEMIRKPIGAHTANQILKDGLDRTFLIEKIRKEGKTSINAERVTERLLKLAQEFERYTKAKEIPLGETDDALYDRGETGLREGESAIQIQTGTDSQASSPEQSPPSLPESRSGP